MWCEEGCTNKSSDLTGINVIKGNKFSYLSSLLVILAWDEVDIEGWGNISTYLQKKVAIQYLPGFQLNLYTTYS